MLGKGASGAILVSDKDMEFSQTMHEAIFEPFVQISTGLTRRADGSGLVSPSFASLQTAGRRRNGRERRR